MKLLMVQPYGDGAGHFAKYTLRLCQSMAAAGHEVTLVVNVIDTTVYLPEGPAFEIIQLGADYAFFRFERARLRSQIFWMIGRIRTNVAVLRRALELCESRHFDVVQLFSYEIVSTWLTLSAAGHRPLPPVNIEIAAPNFSPEKHYGSSLERAWRRLMGYCMRALVHGPIRGINVNSASHAPELRRQLELRPTYPIQVVSDTREIPETPMPKADARSVIGLDGYGGPVFLFFGTLRRDKGISTLAKAIPLLAGEDFRLVIAGMPLDWDYPDEAARLLSDPRILAHRRYIAEAEVDAYFYAADALVLPYPGFYAGSSGPMYEACARGLPVIASDVSEMGPFVRSARNGLLVPPDDPAALADAMRRFADLPIVDREQLGTNALAVAHANDRSTVAARFVSLYQRLAVAGSPV